MTIKKASDETGVRTKLEWKTVESGMPVVVTNFNTDLEIYRGHGQYCFYVWIVERDWPAVFDRLWLPDKLVKFIPESPERVTHDYDKLPWVHDALWHGGITYYAKHGHSPRHRAVELGCDYAHLWDSERGYNYHWHEIMFDARRTARKLHKILTAVSEGRLWPMDEDEDC